MGMFARMALLEHLALQPRDEHPPGGDRHPPHLPQPPLHHPDEHYLPLWSKRSAAWTAAASVTLLWNDTPSPPRRAGTLRRGNFPFRTKIQKRD